MRLLVSTSLILAWAMPALTATVVWQWIFDTQYGLVNWALGRQGESWLAEPMTLLLRGDDHRRLDGHPVRRLHRVRRADARSRPSCIEAAQPRRRRRPWQRFRYVVFPALKPILLILTSLSVLWDFRVFTQIYVLQQAGGISRDTNLLGVYAYRISIGQNDFDIGAAVAVVMMLITVLLTVAYLRSMIVRTRTRMTMRSPSRAGSRSASTRPARSSPAIALFPVYWMVLTSFRRGVDIQSADPIVPAVPRHARQLPQGVRARLLLDGDRATA